MGPKAKTEDKKPAEEKSSEANKDELEPDEDDENKAKNKKIPEVQALEGEHVKLNRLISSSPDERMLPICRDPGELPTD